MDNAVLLNNQQAPGLGLEFLDEADKVLRRIHAHPDARQEIAPGLRRGLLARFPYGLIYGTDKDSIIVVAIAHLHRKPHYWVERFQDKF